MSYLMAEVARESHFSFVYLHYFCVHISLEPTAYIHSSLFFFEDFDSVKTKRKSRHFRRRQHVVK